MAIAQPKRKANEKAVPKLPTPNVFFLARIAKKPLNLREPEKVEPAPIRT
jgi:hypothetical protein